MNDNRIHDHPWQNLTPPNIALSPKTAQRIQRFFANLMRGCLLKLWALECLHDKFVTQRDYQAARSMKDMIHDELRLLKRSQELVLSLGLNVVFPKVMTTFQRSTPGRAVVFFAVRACVVLSYRGIISAIYGNTHAQLAALALARRAGWLRRTPYVLPLLDWLFQTKACHAACLLRLQPQLGGSLPFLVFSWLGNKVNKPSFTVADGHKALPQFGLFSRLAAHVISRSTLSQVAFRQKRAKRTQAEKWPVLSQVPEWEKSGSPHVARNA